MRVASNVFWLHAKVLYKLDSDACSGTSKGKEDISAGGFTKGFALEAAEEASPALLPLLFPPGDLGPEAPADLRMAVFFFCCVFLGCFFAAKAVLLVEKQLVVDEEGSHPIAFFKNAFVEVDAFIAGRVMMASSFREAFFSSFPRQNPMSESRGKKQGEEAE